MNTFYLPGVKKPGSYIFRTIEKLSQTITWYLDILNSGRVFRYTQKMKFFYTPSLRILI